MSPITPLVDRRAGSAFLLPKNYSPKESDDEDSGGSPNSFGIASCFATSQLCSARKGRKRSATRYKCQTRRPSKRIKKVTRRTAIVAGIPTAVTGAVLTFLGCPVGPLFVSLGVICFATYGALKKK